MKYFIAGMPNALKLRHLRPRYAVHADIGYDDVFDEAGEPFRKRFQRFADHGFKFSTRQMPVAISSVLLSGASSPSLRRGNRKPWAKGLTIRWILDRTALCSMFGELTPNAIEALLHEEIVARIAYVDRRGLPCIVPITYTYDGRAFYGYSLLGAKIEHMAANPRVCVEVDRVENAADWCSVVARGTFERLHGRMAVEAVERISERLRTVGAATTAPVMTFRTFVTRTGGDGIAYRIDINEKHGRYSASGQD